MCYFYFIYLYIFISQEYIYIYIFIYFIFFYLYILFGPDIGSYFYCLVVLIFKSAVVSTGY